MIAITFADYTPGYLVYDSNYIDVTDCTYSSGTLYFVPEDVVSDCSITWTVVEIPKPKAHPPAIRLDMRATKNREAVARVIRRPRSRFKGIGTRNWHGSKKAG